MHSTPTLHTLATPHPIHAARPRAVIRFCKYVLTVFLSLAGLTSLPAIGSRIHGQTVAVDVVDRRSGQVLDVLHARGERWIVGAPGHEYLLRLTNRTGARVLAVTSVDGVNVVTGETAAPSQSGYVLAPGGTVEIAGWRKSLATTAAFYFTDLGDAYASRTGRPEDVGVIGVAVFRERVRIADQAWPAEGGLAKQNAARDRAESRADGAQGPAAAPSLGTGHGRHEASPVTRVRFERASTEPAEVLALRYDRRENLVALGILPPAPLASAPRPFPDWNRGFVADPPR